VVVLFEQGRVREGSGPLKAPGAATVSRNHIVSRRAGLVEEIFAGCAEGAMGVRSANLRWWMVRLPMAFPHSFRLDM
jgi:hypothetical protein